MRGARAISAPYEFVAPPAPPATSTATVTLPGPPIAAIRGCSAPRRLIVCVDGRSYGLSTVTGHTDVAVLSVDTPIQRLNPSTLYRFVASNPAGTRYGADRTLAGKLSTRPRTNQLGLISPGTLVLR